MKKIAPVFIIFLFANNCANAQLMAYKEVFTHEDSLRGTLNADRTWWNVLRYDITVKPDYNTKTIEGKCGISFKPLSNGDIMQIDLQEPLIIDSAVYSGSSLTDIKKTSKNTWSIHFAETVHIDAGSNNNALTIFYHGKPREAITPPWDGGWIWKKDSLGRPWMSVACQGLGASVWYPCKDHQSDEPDNGATLTVIVPDTLIAVGNGRLVEKSKIKNQNNLISYTWEVKNPINNYNIIPYIGKYVNFTDTVHGEKGALDLSYWVLDYNLQKAREQFTQAKTVLHCLEYWWGPYPFYEDGYKLVESPHLGMEHQSAVAYGNGYINGYRGGDLSHSGWGTKWDFIIEHETAHEWFGNNITTNDLADMWVHESFANYSETLYTEWLFGKDAGQDYVSGIRKNIQNDIPIIGPYGVNKEGSGDQYYKGGNLLQNIRHIINDDVLFRKILRGLSETYYHKTVNTSDIENYISSQSGINFSKTFDQYLRSTSIPVFEFYADRKKRLCYRWDSCVRKFNMPLTLQNGQRIYPTAKWKKISGINDFNEAWLQRNYYIGIKKMK